MLLLEVTRIIVGEKKMVQLSLATHVGMESRDSKTGGFQWQVLASLCLMSPRSPMMTGCKKGYELGGAFHSIFECPGKKRKWPEH